MTVARWMEATTTLNHRGLVPTPTPARDISKLAAGFETTYQRSYVTDEPKKGESYPRAPRARSDIASVMAISGTSMADSSPTQRASYRNPAAGPGPATLTKIQQPKSTDFSPTALKSTQTRCK
jgi:hypothetical protein